LAAAIIMPCALVAAYGAIALAGTKTGVALAVLAVLGPIAAYAAFTAPLVFPFCLYILLVPFDNLLDLQSFGTVTKLLGVLCGAAVVFWLIRTRRYVVPDRAVAAWLVFVLLAGVSVAWAIDPVAVATPTMTLAELFVLYAVLAFAPTGTKTLKIVVQTVILSGAIAAAYGAYVFYHGADLVAGRLFLATSSGNGTRTYIDPNHFAASLLLPIALALVTVVESRRVAAQLFATACLVVMGAGIASAGSRGSVVAIAVMIAYLLIRSRKRLLLGSVGIAGIGIAFVSHASVVQRFARAAATGGAGRLEIWKVGLLAFERHPLFGVGFGNFPLAYNQFYVSASLTQYFHWNQPPHNNLLWAAVELGIVGLLVFLYAWWAQFHSLRLISPNDPFYPVRLAVEAGLVGLFVASLFLGTITYKYLWLAFILVALVRNAWIANGSFTARGAHSP
jgi:O-antigen ligase